jgi:hypothetical protein
MTIFPLDSFTAEIALFVAVVAAAAAVDVVHLVLFRWRIVSVGDNSK